jgi:transposase-like protein
MERRWLAEQMEAGRSIEAIAREVGRHPSTVAYWVNKHGLASALAARHTPKGPLEAEVLEALAAEGLTVAEMAARVDRGATTVRYWLKRYGVRTERSTVRGMDARERRIIARCLKHGHTVFVVNAAGTRRRCRACRAERVSARRRRLKAILVAEAGGACVLCGYDRHRGALQFHHVDPADKAFALSTQGLARSLSKARAEVAKCILVCANCHAEVEGGAATIPPEVTVRMA